MRRSHAKTEELLFPRFLSEVALPTSSGRETDAPESRVLRSDGLERVLIPFGQIGLRRESTRSEKKPGLSPQRTGPGHRKGTAAYEGP